MYLHITQLYPRTNLNYATQESLRRRMKLLLCKFYRGCAYILVPAQMQAQLQQAGRFTIVLHETKKIPLMKQHMQLQTTGKIQTHQTEIHRYIATVMDINTNVGGVPLYISTN